MREMINTLTTYRRHGWIRFPIDKWQWTIAYLPIFKLQPRNDWRKQGFFNISNEDGQRVLNWISSTMKERNSKGYSLPAAPVIPATHVPQLRLF